MYLHTYTCHFQPAQCRIHTVHGVTSDLEIPYLNKKITYSQSETKTSETFTTTAWFHSRGMYIYYIHDPVNRGIKLLNIL